MTSEGFILGIDLGTTNSVVSVADGAEARVLPTEFGKRLIPSVVSFRPDNAVVVGEDARERRLVDAQNTVYSVKRLIGRPFRSPEVRLAQQRFAFELVESPSGGVVVRARGETYTLTEISAFVLREIRRVAEWNLGGSVSKAVVTVPANFNELQRSATRAAGRVAGLDIVRIINEPTAAALAYGLGRSKGEKVAVYDLGGGTFDLTILELDSDVFEVLSTAGDSFLGGDDVDLTLAEKMADACKQETGFDVRSDPQAFERLRAAAEWAKCELSVQEQVRLTLEDLRPGAARLDFRYETTRAAFEQISFPLIARSFDVCNQALAEARMKAGDVDSVVMVGGSTRIPLVRKMVREFFGKEPHTGIDPDLVVSQGAAIHAFSIAGKSAPKAALGKVGLKKMSKAELDGIKAKRAAAQEVMPAGPAFAPTVDYASMVANVDEPTGAVRKPKTPFTVPKPKAPGAKASSGDLGALLRSQAGEAKAPVEVIEPAVVAPVVVSRAAVAQAKPASLPPEELLDDDELEILPLPAADADFNWDGATSVAAPPPLRPAVAEAPIFDEDVGTEYEFDGLSLEDDEESTTLDGLGFPSAPPAPMVDATGAPMLMSLAMPNAPAPMLMDVLPHSLGIETAGGYCQHLIRRSAPIPAEQSRVFSTGADGQTNVAIRICQGEDRQFKENQVLGEVELSGLRNAKRGDVKIDVTFLLDASGTLDVRAMDVETGQRQEIRINLLGGADDAELDRMRARQEQMFG